MLAVKPIPDAALSRELCEMCGVGYDPAAFLYMASDVEPDLSRINRVIGICTFVISGDRREIVSIAQSPGVDDIEAMIIMVRAVMNFMYRCEVERVTLSDSAASDGMAERLGFTLHDGRYSIDLNEFYKAPCKFGDGSVSEIQHG